VPGLTVSPLCRVIVDNDYQGDPDGLVALAHHLVSPANRVTVVTSSFLNPRFPSAGSRAQDGAALASELLEATGGTWRPPVHAGSEEPFGQGSRSAASAAIVDEARRDDDQAAAEFVFGQPELEIHQFPLETYRRCAYSVAELEHDLSGCGLLGQWLWEHFCDPPDWVRIGGVWPLGDSPTVLVTALSTESSVAALSPGTGRVARRRVYTDPDFRLLVGDMLARFRLHERHGGT
jgi:hypothetical protein